MPLINFNGALLPAGQPLFGVQNRAFRYGDGLFETIRMFDGQLPFLSRHIARLHKGMAILGFDIPAAYHPDFFASEIEKLRREAFAGQFNLRIRLSVFRTEGGLYAPVSNCPEFVIEMHPLPGSRFELNTLPLSCSVFEAVPLQPGLLSPLKTINSLPYVLAAMHRQKTGADECLILNTHGHIAEAVSANVFVVQPSGALLTPALSQGCIEGVMRGVIINWLKGQGMEVTEGVLQLADWEEARAAFSSNSIAGLRWIKGERKLVEWMVEGINGGIGKDGL